MFQHKNVSVKSHLVWKFLEKCFHIFKNTN